MSTLLLRCPQRPPDSSFQEWNEQELHFEWALSDGMWQKGQIENVPFAEEIIAILPSVDVRLISLKVPTIADKKLQLVLPSLLDDELLSSVNQSEIQLLPKLPNESASNRTVAIIDMEWFKWINNRLSQLVFKSIRLIPEFFLLPFNSSSPLCFFKDENSTRNIYYFDSGYWRSLYGRNQ
jgi:type II secretory pathway component PulL